MKVEQVAINSTQYLDPDTKGTRVSIIGLGREGKALARFLAHRGAVVTVSDIKGENELMDTMRELSDLPLKFALGGHAEHLLEADIIYVSPGVRSDIPILVKAQKQGIPISSETALFFRLCRAPIIGITGSSGKTTTVSLVGEMLKVSGFKTFVGGNIGTPLIEMADRIKPNAWVVMELSSFQLENLGASPHIASILNITPNHLDRHPHMEAYIAAKARILQHQKANDHAVLSRDDPEAYSLVNKCKGKLLLFSRKREIKEGTCLRSGQIILRRREVETPICPVAEVRLLGEHNLENVLAACAISSLAGASIEAMSEVSRTFKGVEHRLELVRKIKGVLYYNDSIATSPERTIAALKSFSQPIVLLAGGREKHLPLEELANLILQKVKCLILFGEAAELMEEATRKAQARRRDFSLPVSRVNDLEEAVSLASQRSQRGDVVLLSPACTSFDMYRDFAERGEHFKVLVGAIKDA